MTTNQTHIPEPTSLYSVVVGKLDGETLIAVRADDDSVPWMLLLEPGHFEWQEWTDLCRKLTDIRVVDLAEVAAEINRLTDRVAELEAAVTRAKKVHRKSRARLLDRIDELEAAKPEPGPWLRGDELQAVMPTLKEGDVVEVDYGGHTATGELWEAKPGFLLLLTFTVRLPNGRHGAAIHALRIIERATEPEPGADIPDEVVEAALDVLEAAHVDTIRTKAWDSMRTTRAALAAAEAKRAELEGQA